MDKSKFGQFIKEARKNKNLTQKQLADLLYLDVTAVSKWERGVSFPDITLIPDICKVLEVSEAELIQSSYDTNYRKMKKDAEVYNKTKNVIFWTFSILYLTALIVCFIVNLGVEKKLSWFFIVLTGILCGFTFIPTVTRFVSSKKLLVFLGSTLLSMFLLFLTVSIYTDNYWFMIATVGVILGYSIIFYPIIFTRQKRYMSEDKYEKLSKYFLISYSSIILILLIILLFVINIYNPYDLSLAIVISSSILALPIVYGIFVMFSKGKIMAWILIGILSISVVGILTAGVIKFFNNEYIENTYEITESYTDIEIRVSDIDINITFVDDTSTLISTNLKENTNVSAQVSGNLLYITQDDDYKWYDHMWNINKNSMDIYLSVRVFDSLKVYGSTGDIILDKGLKIDDVKIKVSTGNIEVLSEDINSLNLECSTGDIKIDNMIAGGEVNLVTSTGDIKLNEVGCKTLNIEVSTGDVYLVDVIVLGDLLLNGGTSDVKLERFDAANIEIEVSTGDVTGTILTSKVFYAKTSTGKVDVPESLTGGKCRVTTSTGNIIIKYC